MTQQSQHRSQRIDDLAHAFGISRQGTGREENQDAFAIDDHLWIVADGMGGHDGGRLASAVAVATATVNVAPDADLAEVVDLCHVTVLTAGQVADCPDMGSTLVLAVRDPESGTVQVAWCGDSRAYVLVDGQLRRLTADHNLAEEERAAGLISTDEVHDHPGQGILTSALGCGSVDTPTIGLVELESRGRLLLCTDGLTAGLRDDDIASLLSHEDLGEAADRLVTAAAAAGSTDDTTVVIVDLEQEVVEEPTGLDDEGELAHVAEAVTALGATVSRTRDGVVDFRLGRTPGIAYDKGGQLLRMSFFLDLGDIDLDEATAWVEAQARPRTGTLEASEGDGQVLLRLLVERLLPLEDEDAAVIAAEGRAYAEAWHDRRTLAEEDLPSPRHTPPSVLTREPQDAWLLYGSRRSVFSAEERADFMLDWEEGIHSVNWTVPKHARPGDLVWIYFKAPLKEVRYAARVGSHPYFDPQLVAEADRPLAAQQWWAWLTPLQEVGPVPLAMLQEIAGERLVGRVHGGTYLRPEVSNALVDLVSSGPAAGEGTYQAQVCRRLGHRDGLPDPETMGWEAWTRVPAQQLRLEADVERYVAEPLLRRVVAQVQGASLVRQKQLTKLVPDYAVEVDGRVVLVVEVKQRITRRRGQDWDDVVEAEQLRRYMRARNCPGLLIDAHEVHLFGSETGDPQQTAARSSASTTLVEQVADMLPTQVRSSGGYQEMLRGLQAESLVLPPLGNVAPTDVQSLGEWWWGSTALRYQDLYTFDPVFLGRVVRQEDVFTLTHVGHGANSHALTLVTRLGPMAICLQLAYGGAYRDREVERSKANQWFRQLSELAKHVATSEPSRYMLIYSDFSGLQALVSLDEVEKGGRSVVHEQRLDSEVELFTLADEIMQGRKP